MVSSRLPSGFAIAPRMVAGLPSGRYTSATAYV